MTDPRAGLRKAISALVSLHCVLLAGFLPSQQIWGGQVAIPGCPGTSVEIANHTFNTGDAANCQALVKIAVGSNVTLSTGSSLSLCAPSITFEGPISVANGAQLSVGNSACSMGSPYNQAILGPLSGTAINAYRLTDLSHPVEGPIEAATSTSDLNLAGAFFLRLGSIPDDEWILVTATGGLDLDADDDGVLDASPTDSLGTLHALAKAQDWRSGGIHVTALSDMVWRYTHNLIGVVDPAELAIRLGDLALQLVAEDMDDSGTIDPNDILAFSPRDPLHQDRLNFDFARLFLQDDMGVSIVGAIHAGDEDLLAEQLDLHFGHTLTRYPVPDSRYASIKVEVELFGHGSVVSDGAYGLSVDSEQPADANVSKVYLPSDPTQTLRLTATPTAETKISSWQGCDWVSVDKTQCEVELGTPHDIALSFAATTFQASAPVHDLSRTINTLSPDSIDVYIPDGIDDLVTQAATVQIGDFLAGATGNGFLRKVTSVTQLQAHHYVFGTLEASLEEVILDGTGEFT